MSGCAVTCVKGSFRRASLSRLDPARIQPSLAAPVAMTTLAVDLGEAQEKDTFLVCMKDEDLLFLLEFPWDIVPECLVSPYLGEGWRLLGMRQGGSKGGLWLSPPMTLQ